jgi:hypothetical protein
MTITTCKACRQPFHPRRDGAQYCSGRCRVAAHRRREALVLRPPPTVWTGDAPQLASYAAGDDDRLSNAELGARLVEIADEEDGGEAKTGRRFYYLALSHGYIRPDMSATREGVKSRLAAVKRITSILGTLRKNGDLSWEAVLDLTRELDEWQVYASPREARAAMRSRYDEDRWLGQPRYPIFIVEKDTMEPVCRPMASDWQMPFASSRGYGSLKLQYDVAAMLNRRFAATGQAAMIYFISDLDPSGLDLQRAWVEALENFGVEIAGFVRLGLNRDQVDALESPLLRQGIEVKDSDSRSKAFIAQYGSRCWETDILPGVVIEAALNRHVRSWLDVKEWNQRAAEIERARALL